LFCWTDGMLMRKLHTHANCIVPVKAKERLDAATWANLETTVRCTDASQSDDDTGAATKQSNKIAVTQLTGVKKIALCFFAGVDDCLPQFAFCEVWESNWLMRWSHSVPCQNIADGHLIDTNHPVGRQCQEWTSDNSMHDKVTFLLRCSNMFSRQFSWSAPKRKQLWAAFRVFSFWILHNLFSLSSFFFIAQVVNAQRKWMWQTFIAASSQQWWTAVDFMKEGTWRWSTSTRRSHGWCTPQQMQFLCCESCEGGWPSSLSHPARLTSTIPSRQNTQLFVYSEFFSITNYRNRKHFPPYHQLSTRIGLSDLEKWRGKKHFGHVPDVTPLLSLIKTTGLARTAAFIFCHTQLFRIQNTVSYILYQYDC